MGAPSDLTCEEQAHVRVALRFLRTRMGGLAGLARALGCKPSRIRHEIWDEPVSTSMAFRVARLAGVGVDALLAGEYPQPGACPRCGHVADPEADRGPLGGVAPAAQTTGTALLSLPSPSTYAIR